MGDTDNKVATCLSIGRGSAQRSIGRVIERGEDSYYRIDDYDAVPPFLVSLTSPANHWMYLSTTGGITAGRKNADHAIFPYTTSDRVADSATTTGGVTVLLVQHDGYQLRWEPFSRALDGIYTVRRSVEKSAAGNIITFEENNLDLGLTFRQTWTSSPRYGLVRRCSLSCAVGVDHNVVVLDGVRNTLPALATAAFQGAFSNLLDAYKRSELIADARLGVFALTAVPTDAAEPSEALAATTWWQTGLEPIATLLSTEQLDHFRRTGVVQPETDIKGRRGAYIVVSELSLRGGEEVNWLFCGEVDQSHADVVALLAELRASGGTLFSRVTADVGEATIGLRRILSRNDGIQATGNAITRIHHGSNVMYNVMRGGYFAHDYQVSAADFVEFVGRRNNTVASAQAVFLSSLPNELTVAELRRRADTVGDPDLTRLALEYLPLTFSRRHGDPSRPWNAFSIDTKKEDGSARLTYQGNWRDIFQNWEALLRSSPLFAPNVIAKFLNATTIDGYNPYRVTDDGIEWERPDPDSPWSNIGYWGDHQIIYLLKLLELSEEYLPGSLGQFLTQEIFSFADVPYGIVAFDTMLDDPFNTITFDHERDKAAIHRCDQIGGDGKLVHTPDGAVLHTNMLEKLLILALAKASNLVPEGGIWMNTQRPEWNDANNALVGKGVSVVTTAYLQRYAEFVLRLLSQATVSVLPVLVETAGWATELREILRSVKEAGAEGWTPGARFAFMRRSAATADRFRTRVSGNGPSPNKENIDIALIKDLFVCIERLSAETLMSNRRADGLFHSYNTLAVERDEHGTPMGILLHPLYEMLEGQVAALSSQTVDSRKAEETLKALRSSALYRPDQHSYMLYPNRELPGFPTRNLIDNAAAADNHALRKLLTKPDQRLVIRDHDGGLHFHSSIRNARMLRSAADDLRHGDDNGVLLDRDVESLAALYEDTFAHQYFTGRSGTFYGYEGLGSVYWHMVSKLLLAIQEHVLRAHLHGDHSLVDALRRRYYDVRSGIGFNKTPDEYGAFPVDAYSHTPYGGGARQPGMTGQVKEEIIARFAELGLYVIDGRILFDRLLVEEDEYCHEPGALQYVDVHGTARDLQVPAGSYAFTFCQTPILVSAAGAADRIVLHRGEEQTTEVDFPWCPSDASRAVFEKSGEITRIEVTFRSR